MAVDVYEAVAAINAVLDYRGDTAAAATVAAYLDENAPVADGPDEYAGMTRAELAAELGRRGVAVSGRTSKAELVAQLRELDEG